MYPPHPKNYNRNVTSELTYETIHVYSTSETTTYENTREEHVKPESTLYGSETSVHYDTVVIKILTMHYIYSKVAQCSITLVRLSRCLKLGG